MRARHARFPRLYRAVPPPYAPPPMRRVALFISRFLQYSQTFVYEEIRAHQRYHVEVFTRAIENQERFPYASVNVAGPLYAVSGYSPRFHRRFAEDGLEL